MERVSDQRQIRTLPGGGGGARDLALRLYNGSALLRGLYRGARRQWSRWRLRRTVSERLQKGGALRVVIGANRKVQSGWVGTEIYSLNVLRERDWERCFPMQSIDALVAEHVWEHLTEEQGLWAAKLCFEYLRPGGYLRMAVPDGCFPDRDYIEYVRPGGSGPSAEDHKVLYTRRSLGAVLERAGFEVRALEYYDEGGEFRASEWRAEDGYIERSTKNAKRRWFGGRQYTSLVMDAVKPLR